MYQDELVEEYERQEIDKFILGMKNECILRKQSNCVRIKYIKDENGSEGTRIMRIGSL